MIRFTQLNEVLHIIKNEILGVMVPVRGCLVGSRDDVCILPLPSLNSVGVEGES